MAWLTLYLAPDAIARSLSLRSDGLQAGQFAPIAPGRFRTFGGSDAVVYAEGVDADGTLTNVFVERDRDGTVEVALAQRARHSVGRDGMTHTITLYDGERFEGIPGSPKFRIMRFTENTIPVEVPKLSDAVTALEAEPTRTLLDSDDREKRAELHWRIADARDVRGAHVARRAVEPAAAARRALCAVAAGGADLLRLFDDPVRRQGVDRARQGAGSSSGSGGCTSS